MAPRPAGRPLGRRRRRLYWTGAILVTLTLAGGAVGFAVFRSSQPETYRPGERHAGITRALDLELPEGAPEPRFEDVSEEAGLAEFRTFAGQRSSQLPEDMGPGAAWGDFDNDGDDDLLLVSAGGALTAPVDALAPSQLYENLGDGSFARSEAFPDTRIVGMGAAWGDYDGDGWLDLVLTGFGALRLFHSESGTLIPDAAIASRPGFWAGASWSDFDRDGDLDLYVCGYVQYDADDQGKRRATRQYGRSVPYTLNPASFRPASNLLFRNLGDGTFEEVAEELGVSNPAGRSLGALWHDLDDDGWPDLYVANDISDNVLYLNREGRFEDVSHAAWVADYRGAMGLAAGDWNRDGDDDLLVTHWVAQENALYDSLLVDQRRRRPPDAEEQPLAFVDVADQRGLGQIALQRIGWGAEFADLDADGWLDLVVANGSTFEEDGELKRLTPELSFLFWSRRGESFHDLAPLSEAWSTPKVSRGLALSDYDLDGDLDLLFVDSGEGVRLLRNDIPQGHWIQLRLQAGSGDGVGQGAVTGARVIARLGDVDLRRTVSSVSYLSQSSQRVHFGLGQASSVETVEVHWPSGTVQQFRGLEADAIWELREGEPEPRRELAARVLTREELREFWRLQRAAMDAMKVDHDLPRAAGLFVEALALDPRHEDSIYYLGNCLAGQGDVAAALGRFARLMQLNPMSHRAFKRWGTLRALTASSREELTEAQQALERAVAINPEATGAPLAVAEINLLLGDLASAKRHLEGIRSTNPDSAEAAFLLGYVLWRQGDRRAAREMLERTSGDGEQWRPEDAAAEGDTRELMHTEQTLLRRFYERRGTSNDPAETFLPLDTFVRDWPL